MTRRTHKSNNNAIINPIPPMILDLHLTINMSADYFFVHGMVFLHNIPKGYMFRTIEHEVQ